MTTVNCQQCGKSFKKKTPRHKFCRLRCKDRWHNEHNPRGIYAHLKDQIDEGPEGWDGHKDFLGF